MNYLKKHGWIAGMAICLDLIFFKYWESYLSNGSVYDGKHGITFFGEATIGHLVGSTLGMVLLNYYFIKSIVEFYRAK